MKISECFPDDYVVIDTETSGLDPVKDRILEIGVIEIKNRKSKAVGAWILNPHFPYKTFVVSEEITKITGITSEMVANGKDPKRILKWLRDRYDDSFIYAHNGIKFDMLFMERECSIQGIEQFKRTKFLDSAAIFKACRLKILYKLNDMTFFDFATMVLETRVFGVYFNLGYCCKVLDIDVTDLGNAHRAKADVMMTQRVIEALRVKLSENETTD
jgi:DNA polymerase III epsilon subunit-like protein